MARDVHAMTMPDAFGVGFVVFPAQLRAWRLISAAAHVTNNDAAAINPVLQCLDGVGLTLWAAGAASPLAAAAMRIVIANQGIVEFANASYIGFPVSGNWIEPEWQLLWNFTSAAAAPTPPDFFSLTATFEYR